MESQTSHIPEIILNGPALQPPPGVVPDFEHPWNLNSVGLLTNALCLTSTLLACSIRVYSKLFCSKKIQLEEASIWCSYHIISTSGTFTHQWNIRLRDLNSTLYPMSAPALSNPNMKAMIVKEPYGVVFSVASWNSPYILGMRSTILPIAAGNTVVLKGSELSPRCFSAIASVLLKAGLPAGVLNYISTDRGRAHDVTEAIISHREVKKLNFTGSIAVGRIVSELAARHLKPVLLELGGQASAIVWEDADLDLAVTECVAGSFMYAGQCCMSTDKVILHKTIRDEFMQKLISAIKTEFPSADEARLMIQPSGKDKVIALLEDAERKGAVITSPTLEGKCTTSLDHDPTRLEPRILSGVTPDMNIYQQENFGPTLSIFEVDTEEEALRLANDAECGLSSAVFTQDLLRGFRLAEEIEAGAVHVNNMSIHDESALPHGGCKASGFGRFNTEHGLSEWLRTKTITWKK
ncbi:aldehyde dehydrogenase domain-containing protein [Xylaria sp. FL1042]|nr:aldehyde dehydrogenase domain-containing protein [Xylaria sp. FL1042]